MDRHNGPPPQDTLIGQTIGNYLVTQKVGEGGMGSVYLAEHPTIGKKVALKVLHAEFSSNNEVAERFFHEAKAVNNIAHPNIVDIVDYGVIESATGDSLVYFIMEYLAGNTLSNLIRAEAPLPPERALAICLQVGDALAASHKCNIVHRDLKPDNIILIQRGREKDFVKLLDFGIAKLTGDGAGSHKTRTGIVMGTPAYMSPEQCEGRANVDHRTDIYALGIVLYEMLTGRVPFIGEGYGEILVQHLTQVPLPPSQYRMLPPHVEAVVLKALEKRVEFRYPNMDEMMRAMGDPVGYVEANGGIATFQKRQLMPSTAPIPSDLKISAAQLTPPPGSIPSVPGVSLVQAMPSAPTTLGAATGQVSPSKPSKAPFAVAAAVIIAAAAGGIGFILSSGDDPVKAVESATPGSDATALGSGAAGSAVTAGSATTAGGGTTAGSAGSDATTVTAGSGATAGSDAGSGSAGSATMAGSGAAGSAAAAVLPATVTINTRPQGAQVWVDGKDLGVVTPDPFALMPDKKYSITLKLARHEDRVLEDVSSSDDLSKVIELKKKPRTGTSGPTGRGSGGTGRGSGRTNDTGLERPE